MCSLQHIIAPVTTEMTSVLTRLTSRGFQRCATASTRVETVTTPTTPTMERATTPTERATTSLDGCTTPKPFVDIPGPKSLPLVGTLWRYLPFIGEYSFDRLHVNGRSKMSRFGPLVREEMMPGVHVVWAFTPQDVEAVFRAEGRHPQRRSHLALDKYRKDRPGVYNTGGLLPTNGPDWMKLRSVFQRGLSSPKNVKSYLPMTDAILDEFMARIDRTLDAGGPPADFLPALSRLYLELICLVAFDVRMGALSESEEDPSSRSSRLIESALDANSCILPTDNGPRLWRFFNTRLYRKLSKALGFIEEVAVDLVNRKVASRLEDIRGPEDGRQVSLLELYLSSPELDVKDVVGMAVDMILGGIDTTTYTSSFALYHLARSPRAQACLLAEARSLLPGDECAVSSEVLSKATYTKAVLKETLRMNPISVGVGRILARDAVLSGYLVPKGTVVVTQNQVTCRLAEHFSEPDSFVPERWVKGHAQNVPTSPYLVLPFGHGPRTCIARRLAEQNMQAFLIKVVRRYEIGWAGGELDVKSLLINKPDQPVLATFTRR